MNEKSKQERDAHQKELLILKKENKHVQLIKKAIVDMYLIYKEALRLRKPSLVYSIYLREQFLS